MNSDDKFDYSYSAPTEAERREIESIKNQFVPAERKEDKITKLRKLNRQVNNPPKIFAYIFGTVALLVFGLGMTMALEWNLYIWGGIVSFIGALLMCVTYPIFKAFLAHRKKLFGQQIIELSDDLLNG